MYSKAPTNTKRAPIDRHEYLVRASEFARYGEDLPQSKLTKSDIDGIKSAVIQRDRLRVHIANNLSNEALARRLGVHIRTIEKVVQGRTWFRSNN